MFTMVECHRSASFDRVNRAKWFQPGPIRRALRKDYLARRRAYGPDNQFGQCHREFWARTRRWNLRRVPKAVSDKR